MVENHYSSEVIVIGGGPAGLSAGLWCSELGMGTTLFENGKELGGQLLNIHNRIENYLGIDAGDGHEMRNQFIRTIDKRDFTRQLNAGIANIDAADRTVTLINGQVWAFSVLIIATGVRRRRLAVHGESEFEGKGIIDSGAKYRENAIGKNVVIVGGGDAAVENALILGELAKKVFVVHRRAELSARQEFVDRAKENPRIEFLRNHIVKEFAGSDELETVNLINSENGEFAKIPADIALIRVGVQPNTEFLEGQLNVDDQNYILTNAACASSVPGIFAIGDAANPLSPTISTAVGSGATAAKAAFDWTAVPKPV